MKRVSLALALLCSGMAAHAEDPPATACQSFMVCGSYEGSGEWYTVDGKEKDSKFLEKINLTGVNANTIGIEVYIYGENEARGWMGFESQSRFQSVGSI